MSYDDFAATLSLLRDSRSGVFSEGGHLVRSQGS